MRNERKLRINAPDLGPDLGPEKVCLTFSVADRRDIEPQMSNL